MLDLHRELLADSTRTLAYREALRQLVTPGDVVVDLGSGSGVLAFFACEAGARRVYAIEKQHDADVAQFLARHLRYDDRVAVIHEHSTAIDLPERGDVLVTETLGSLALEERILSSVIDARRRLLRKNAIIIPSRIVVSLVPVQLPAPFAEHVAWWNEPRFGLDFSPLSVFASNAIYTAEIDPEAHLSPPAEVLDLDLCTIEDAEVSGTASYVIKRDALLHGFGGWFTATLAPGLALSNARPRMSHWSQAFLPLERPVPVAPGTKVSLELQSHDGKAWRWRGRIESEPPVTFDQTTWLAGPPCIR